jgi:hypothetical protein
MNKKLENCLCGARPRRRTRPINGDDVRYHYIECSKGCENDYISRTFATRLPEFCAELWNATIRRQHEMKKVKNKS